MAPGFAAPRRSWPALAVPCAVALMLAQPAQAAPSDEDRKMAEVWGEEASGYAKKGQLELAEKYFLRARKLDPARPEYVYGVARVLFLRKQWQAAEPEFVRFLSMARGHPKAAAAREQLAKIVAAQSVKSPAPAVRKSELERQRTSKGKPAPLPPSKGKPARIAAAKAAAAKAAAAKAAAKPKAAVKASTKSAAAAKPAAGTGGTKPQTPAQVKASKMASLAQKSTNAKLKVLYLQKAVKADPKNTHYRSLLEIAQEELKAAQK